MIAVYSTFVVHYRDTIIYAHCMFEKQFNAFIKTNTDMYNVRYWRYVLSVVKYQMNYINGPNLYAYKCITKTLQNLKNFSYTHKNIW